MNIPTEVHLYWTQYGFTMTFNRGLEGHPDYQWLTSAPVDFGEVEFDEKELKLRALNAKLGEAQHKVDQIKEEIQKLLAIGHGEPTPHPFDDDIPF